MTSVPDPDSERREVWRELRSISAIVVELRTMVGVSLGEQSDHEDRLRKLEERRYPIAATATVVAFIAAVIALYTMFHN